MNKLKSFRRGLLGALLLLGTAAPFALTSCDNAHPELNITLTSDYSTLIDAMKDNNKTLIEKLGMIEQAIKNGNTDAKSAQDLLLQAINAINGTLDQKLAAIEEAIKGQTTSLETKLTLIEAAINGGFANNKTALDLIKEALNTLNGTVSEKLAAIEEAIRSQTTSLETKLGLIQTAVETGLADNKTAIEQLKTAIESIKDSTGNLKRTIDSIVSALDDIKGALDTDIATLLQDIKNSIDGIQDYSEILTAIKTAIENIQINAGTPADERAVDLGLPSGLKWASCNIGASKPEEYGDYFAWGETKPYYTEGHAQDNPCTSWREGKDAGYRWASYFDTKDNGSTFETYAQDKEKNLKSENDAATANWGGTWRMPTKDEMDELCTNCDWEWATINGVKGYKVKSKSNDNFIFLPAAGYRSLDSLDFDDDSGYYWLSSLEQTSSSIAYCLIIFEQYTSSGSSFGRISGRSVRAVCP